MGRQPRCVGDLGLLQVRDALLVVRLLREQFEREKSELPPGVPHLVAFEADAQLYACERVEMALRETEARLWRS